MGTDKYRLYLEDAEERAVELQERLRQSEYMYMRARKGGNDRGDAGEGDTSSRASNIIMRLNNESRVQKASTFLGSPYTNRLRGRKVTTVPITIATPDGKIIEEKVPHAGTKDDMPTLSIFMPSPTLKASVICGEGSTPSISEEVSLVTIKVVKENS
ncbi:hypothetical protein Cgig2_017999 [Carnegiea gigantea]|uniref:Uncharacterized protein n=1 Tax=Carnegiea gigantea TaxID=171969 RepID=A0A9Q1GKB2_9CARY|nr:hypothetical protein Cgig2_017999 [Carnegiea gigantea]